METIGTLMMPFFGTGRMSIDGKNELKVEMPLLVLADYVSGVLETEETQFTEADRLLCCPSAQLEHGCSASCVSKKEKDIMSSTRRRIRKELHVDGEIIPSRNAG